MRNHWLLVAVTAAALHAQTPEIRGTVLEQGPNTGLPGVEITLSGFVQARDTLDPRVLAVVYTDARGNFSLKPEALGEYRVDVRKTGYTDARGSQNRDFFRLTAERPVQEIRFVLMNPGAITGRFVDEEDKPIRGLQIQPQPVDGFSVRGAVTGDEGSFTVADMPPGPYLVRASKPQSDAPQMLDYSEAESQRTSLDFESLYWPSGVADARDALPLTVPPGTTTNMGTIRLRQVERYRVHLTLEGDCSGGTWTFAVLTPARQGYITNSSKYAFQCKHELLLANIASGTYELAVWNDEEPIRWALAPLVVTRGNTQLNLTLRPALDITGRLVTSEGVKFPSIKDMFLFLRPERLGLETVDEQQPQIKSDGSILIRGLRWPSYRLITPRLPAPYYVREIRYAGRPAPGGRIELIPGAQLEIEVDDKPASISGTLTFGDKPFTDPAVVLVAKLPLVPSALNAEGNSPDATALPMRSSSFTITGLGPGEYRIAAYPLATGLPPVGPQLEQLLQAGEKIALERGQQKTMQLKLSVR